MSPFNDEVLLILKMNSNWYWFALYNIILIIDDEFFMTTWKWQWILSDIDNDSNFIVKYHTDLNFYIRIFLTWLFITKIDQIFQVKLNFKWFSYCLEVRINSIFSRLESETETKCLCYLFSVCIKLIVNSKLLFKSSSK